MADADPVTSKRLIISGLTPAIDANTLSQRLASFGTVHSLVGVGMLDANGLLQAITLIHEEGKLMLCLNSSQAIRGNSHI